MMLCNYIIKGFERVRGVRKSLFEEMMFDLIFGREIVVMEIQSGGEKGLWKRRWWGGRVYYSLGIDRRQNEGERVRVDFGGLGKGQSFVEYLGFGNRKLFIGER